MPHEPDSDGALVPVTERAFSSTEEPAKAVPQKVSAGLPVLKKGMPLMAADKEIDRLDREILRLISVDASLSLADIAGKVGLTPTPCWKRIRRMEQDGIIRGRVA